MAAPTLYKAAGDKFSTTLAAGISAADLSIQLSSVTGLNSSGGMLIIDEGVSSEEVIAYTSYIGTTLTVPSGGRGLSGTTAAIHSIGAVVKDILVADHVNKAYTSFTAEHSEAGVHSAATVTSLKATTAEIETGTSDVKVITPLGLASSEYGQVYNSMSRQAIINGNFDIWQRGTSLALTDATQCFLADRWMDYVDKNGGTLPTLTRSRQLLTSGDIPNAYYFSRLATNGAGTSLGASSSHRYLERIENGTRNLCGASKTVTVSFYARSSISNKRISPSIRQNYGTGGSPTTEELILGTPVTLTSSWVKYTATFTTNTLVGKTFGTNNDDYLELDLYQMWGATFGNVYVQAGVSAETYVGSGNIDIAQVQLCAGDVALPFQPKSYGQELADCQRYTFVPSVTNQTHFAMGFATSTTALTIIVISPVAMRPGTRSLTITASDWMVWDGVTGTDVTTAAIQSTSFDNFNILNLGVAAGLTQYRPYYMTADAGFPRTLIISAEL